jgi:hypothetical protein
MADSTEANPDLINIELKKGQHELRESLSVVMVATMVLKELEAAHVKDTRPMLAGSCLRMIANQKGRAGASSKDR